MKRLLTRGSSFSAIVTNFRAPSFMLPHNINLKRKVLRTEGSRIWQPECLSWSAVQHGVQSCSPSLSCCTVRLCFACHLHIYFTANETLSLFSRFAGSSCFLMFCLLHLCDVNTLQVPGMIYGTEDIKIITGVI